MSVLLKKVRDFPIETEYMSAWASLDAHVLQLVGGTLPYRTAVQAAWSDSGLYFRFDCEDLCLDCEALPDGGDLYTGDVVELFLQPQASRGVYLELELSPLNAELVLMVCNTDGVFYGWQPWHYENERRTKHAVTVHGGKNPHNSCSGWTAAVFIPFALFEGMISDIPKPGACWTGNAFRIDYGASESRWALDPACGTEFHDVWKHPQLIFGGDTYDPSNNI